MTRGAGSSGRAVTMEVTPPHVPLIVERFPELESKLPWTPLGEFPTPVEPLVGAGDSDSGKLFVKRDDLSSSYYGGNKVRKLEHVLADARDRGRRSLVTVGGLGSNQCLASALYGRKLGFEVDICLFDQPIDAHVVEVLLADVAAGARINYGRGYVRTALEVARTYVSRWARGDRPYYVPPGSTTPLGSIGYVSAGLELGRQVSSGLLPAPDRVYVAAGTCGTLAGILVGLKLAGLESRCVGVQITSGVAVNRPYVKRLARQVVRLLESRIPGFPDIRITDHDFMIEGRYYGGAYGRETGTGRRALEWAAPQFTLETTYTAKALAACLDARREDPSQTLLFWNTFNSAPLELVSDIRELPPRVLETIERSPFGRTHQMK